MGGGQVVRIVVPSTASLKRGLTAMERSSSDGVESAATVRPCSCDACFMPAPVSAVVVAYWTVPAV